MLDLREVMLDIADGTAEGARRSAVVLGLPEWAVRRGEKAQRPPPPHARKWAKWQEDVVKAHLGMFDEEELEAVRRSLPSPDLLDGLGSVDMDEIARRIGRTPEAVKITITRRGWRTWLHNPRWLTGSNIAAMMGVDSHAVTKWIERGYLKADQFPYRERQVHRILPRELESFITNPDNWAYYHPEKIRDEGLRSLAYFVRNGNEYVSSGQLAARLKCSPGWVATLIRRGEIPAKRWGNYWIQRKDAEELVLPGPGGRHDVRLERFTPEEESWVIAARAAGLSYRAAGSKLNRHLSVISHHWKRLEGRGFKGVPEHEAVIISGGRALGSWRLLAKREKLPALKGLARAAGRLKARKSLGREQVVLISGLLYVWLHFFVDGESLVQERRNLKYRQWRAEEPVRAIYERMLDAGLDPCRERWVRKWDVALSGERLSVEPLGDEETEWTEWAEAKARITSGC